MSKNRYYTLFFIFLFVIFFCCSCNKKQETIPEHTIKTSPTETRVYGVDAANKAYCVTDYGILYAENSNIKYYDFETDCAYILCDKANCSHNDNSCSAWYEDESALVGLALYQDACYMFRRNFETNTYDFIKSDFTGNQQQTIARESSRSVLSIVLLLLLSHLR